jgi:hypothetical protein
MPSAIAELGKTLRGSGLAGQVRQKYPPTGEVSFTRSTTTEKILSRIVAARFGIV